MTTTKINTAQLTEMVTEIEDVLYADDGLDNVTEALTAAVFDTEARSKDEADLEEAQIIVKNVASQIDSAKIELYAAIDLINSVINRALEGQAVR